LHWRREQVKLSKSQYIAYHAVQQLEFIKNHTQWALDQIDRPEDRTHSPRALGRALQSALMSPGTVAPAQHTLAGPSAYSGAAACAVNARAVRAWMSSTARARLHQEPLN